MKFNYNLEINLPLVVVFDLYSNSQLFDKWQLGFQSKIQLTGKPYDKGSNSKITYSINKNNIELLETIIEYNKPRRINALYENKHMVNNMKSSFIVLNPYNTKIEVEIHYTKFIGCIPKLIALLNPGFFKKQVQNRMNDFKHFAENK
jgi:hypothetical protein